MDNKYYKLIASLALLRTLYNNDKKNIYNVIAEMARSTIVKNKLRQTSVTELSRLLKKEYGVSIINPVLAYSVKRLSGLKMDQKMGLSVSQVFSANISEEIEQTAIQSRQNNDLMLADLCDFIEEKKGEKLSDKQREQVKADMCYFVSHNLVVDSPYKGYLGSFYMEKQKEDARAFRTFNTIHEGRILYDGLSGSSEFDSIEQFDKPLKVYLETEILFHAAGLNGDLYEHLFNQFYEQVESINKSAIQIKGQRVISLMYFPETENEIGQYFAQAEQILSKKLSPAQPGNAMDVIVSSCKSPADVRIKEYEFWQKLKRLGIHADTTKFDVIQNGQYNLVSAEEVARVKKKHSGVTTINDEQRALDVLQMLSRINYNRRNINARNYKSADSVLVTGRAITLDYSQRLTPKGDVPFAVSMSYLTNRFWFSFHRGLFDSDQSITSDQLLGFAQIAVSQQINEVLHEEFLCLSLDVKEGRLSKEEAIERVSALRSDLVVSPDEVKEMIDDNSCYDFFDRESIARRIEEKELKSQMREDQLENTKIDLVRQKGITEKLLALQNERETIDYNQSKEQYDNQMSQYIRRQVRKQKRKCLCIVVGYLLFFLVALLASILLSKKIQTASIVILFILVAIPVIERFTFRLVNREYLFNAFRYVFNCGGIRLLYEQEKREEYMSAHPEPVLVLSTEDTYLP